MDKNSVIAKSKKRWIALVINLFFGLGYVYIGKFKKYFLLIASYFFILVAVYIDDYFVYASVVSIFVFILFYFYSFIDVFKSFPIKASKYMKFTQWYCLIFCFVLPMQIVGTNTFGFFDYLPARSFIFPSISMENTIIKNDYIFARKYSEIKRGDVVVFISPLDSKTYFAKRVVAMDGDEVVFQDNKLWIHFNESDKNIKAKFPNAKFQVINNKLWVLNPYMSLNNGINYKKNSMNIPFFEMMLHRFVEQDKLAMTPVLIKDFGGQTYQLSNKQVNVLYKKVSASKYFMIGDNRNNSNDSRFWGEVPEENIYGIVTKVYFNPQDISRIGKKVE
jgi:signal peptidase I